MKSIEILLTLLKYANRIAKLSDTIKFLSQNEDIVNARIESDNGFNSFLRNGWHKAFYDFEIDFEENDPQLLNNFAALLNQLQRQDEILLENQEIVEEIREALYSIMEKFFASIDYQIIPLLQMIKKIEKQLCRLASPDILLLELPIGNSVLTKLLSRALLKKASSHRVIKIGLSRNDSATAGETRKSMIEAALKEGGVNQNTLVVYIDEWLSGSNFYSISNFVRKTVKNLNGLFMPIAAVCSDESQGLKDRFVKAHDKILADIGFSGNDFRFIIPSLKLEYSDKEFFWSEYDRIAGYRKMQLWGALFSSFDFAIEQLKSDTRLLIYSYKKLYKHANSEEINPEYDPVKNSKVIIDLYSEWYSEYIENRDKLLTLTHSTNQGTYSDIDENINSLISEINQVIGHTKAINCFKVATFLIRGAYLIDPANRYYFKQHVPLIVELDDGTQLLHETSMAILFSKYLSLKTADN